MKVKLRKGSAELVPENLDDLWLLSELIRPGDVVKMKTSRKLKLRVGERTESEKKAMTLKIMAKETKFHEYNSSLRVSGEIVEGPEDVKGGHTFTVEAGSKLQLEKELSAREKDMLKKAQAPQPDVAFVLVDRDEAMIAHGSSRTWVRAAAASKRTGEEGDEKQFFGQIKARIMEISPKYIIIAGPGFVKDKLAKEVEFEVIVEGASSVGESGLREVLSRGALEKVGVALRESEEHQALESVLAEVKSGKAFYGLKDALALKEQNNILSLLVSSSTIKKSIKDSTYSSLRDLIEKVKYSGGKVMLIGRNKDALARLDGLGGVAGLRRW